MLGMRTADDDRWRSDMTEGGEFDPEHFFDRFTRFLETSETGRPGKRRERFNGRYLALIHANRDLIRGARVLDLASHDGRWSFAALKNGAASVTGIEHKPGLVTKSHENMEFYDLPRSSYEFVLGDMFERIDDLGQFDVVFCFGVFYHVNDHMLLLSKIARRDPTVLIMDTNISQIAAPVVELKHEAVGGTKLVGEPSKAALDAMFESFGWAHEYFGWQESGLCGPHNLSDYWSKRRVTAVVTCRRKES
jgi:predicted nicotinamide N-methyase